MLKGYISPELDHWLDGLPNFADAAISICRMPIPEANGWQGVDGECSDDALESMAPRRREEFRHGRLMAHFARERLGEPPSPVLRAGRVPVWPRGTGGSITHAKDIAAAIATTGKRSFGVDIERLNRVGRALHDRLFTPRELAALQTVQDPHAVSVRFAAKEAGFKAIYPIGQTYVGFHEAEIDVDEINASFTIRYLGRDTATRRLEEGRGFYALFEDHVFALFVI